MPGKHTSEQEYQGNLAHTRPAGQKLINAPHACKRPLPLVMTPHLCHHAHMTTLA